MVLAAQEEKNSLTKNDRSNPRVFGRPSTGGGCKASFRLSAYLIVKLGLKKSKIIRNAESYGSDSQILATTIAKGLAYLKENPDGELSEMLPARSPSGAFKKGWDYDHTVFNQWMPTVLIEEIRPVQEAIKRKRLEKWEQRRKEALDPGEIGKFKSISFNQFVQTLVVIGAAVDGVIQPKVGAIDEIPKREEYQGVEPSKLTIKKSKNKPALMVPKRRKI